MIRINNVMVIIKQIQQQNSKMSRLEYKVSYPESLPSNPNNRNPNNYESKLSQMSMNFASEIDRYTRPDLPVRTQVKFKYDQMNNLISMSNMNVPTNYDRNDYPSSGRHSRFPVLINCDGCNDLTMTDIEYEHGFASKFWCCILLPFFCTGFCCLCLSSCKDVKHICSRCRKEAGTCKSKCI